MDVARLAWKNIGGEAFRSLAVFFCAVLVAGLALTATFVVRGAEAGLRSNLQRLGADILVVPWGTMTEKIGGVRLMSANIEGWMPLSYVDRVSSLQGVSAVSPQLHLATISGSPYSDRPEIFVVAFDPQTDFALGPWLEEGVAQGLAEGEALAGSHVALPQGQEHLSLFGQDLRLVGRLAATGSSIDQTVFVTLTTAHLMAAAGREENGQALKIVPGSISAMMVRVELGSDPHEVALRILDEAHGVVPLETPGLFQAERRQMIGVLRTMLGLLAFTWILAVVFMGLVFTIAVNERRQEIGVLRALGFHSAFILKVLLAEGTILALAGGLAGITATALLLAFFGDQLVNLVRLPLQSPSLLELAAFGLGGLLLTWGSVALAAFIPAWRISHEEVALTMRK